MNEADVIALQTIRKAAENLIPDETWEVMEKQVAEVGIRGLAGTSRAIVEGIVRKHGEPGDRGYSRLHPSDGSGGSSGGSSAGGSPMSSNQRIKEGKKLVSEGEASQSQVVAGGMKEATVKGGGLPRGSKGTVLARGVDMGGGQKGAFIGFDKPVKFKDGDFEESSNVHLVSESDLD